MRHRQIKKSAMIKQPPLLKQRLMRIALIIALAGGILWWGYHQPTLSHSLLTTRLMNIKTWFDEWKNKRLLGQHEQNKLNKTTALATNKTEVEPQIHFEFYNVLPKVQVEDVATRLSSKQEVARKTPSQPLGSPMIANINELEQELSTYIKQNPKRLRDHQK